LSRIFCIIKCGSASKSLNLGTNKVYSLGYGPDSYIAVIENMSNLAEWQTVDSGHDMAFQLHGNAVPLPGSIFLLSSGIVGLAASRFRIKKK